MGEGGHHYVKGWGYSSSPLGGVIDRYLSYQRCLLSLALKVSFGVTFGEVISKNAVMICIRGQLRLKPHLIDLPGA